MLEDKILSNKDKIRFHTPAHGRLDPSLLECDITELCYSDNLFKPDNVLKELEIYLASAYRAEAAFLSTQGATFGIQQAVYALLNRGAFLIIGRAHVSVYNAMRLFNCISYHADELNLKDIPSNVGCVILTVPDYFGNTLPLENIYPALREKNIALIVDAAHGAHFAFSTKLPVSASEYSDLAVLSLHKTLPVLTGGSLLCCRKEYADRCLFARNTLHSTSPNYMTLCTAEKAVKEFSSHGESYYDSIKIAVEEFSNLLTEPFRVVKNNDFSRLVVASPYEGAAVANALFEEGFVAETSMDNRVVFIVTHYNYRSLTDLAEKFGDIKNLPPYQAEPHLFAAHSRPYLLEFSGEWETVPLLKAVGRKLYTEAGLYPPGTPLIYAGEILTPDKARYLDIFSERSFGLVNGCVRVLK